MIDLSIIIVNRNNSKILQECLGSIYKNTRKTALEIIVVDNNSSDGSQDMVKMFFPKVNLIRNEDNAGFSKASNRGLKIFRGRYACLLNNDTIIKESALDRMVEFMDRNANVGACAPKLLNTDGTIQHQGSIFQKKFWMSQIPVEITFAIAACIMVRRETINKVGLLDEKLFFYNEDLDWCKRIIKAGYKIFFVPESEVIHYGGYSSKNEFNKFIFVEGFRGGLYFVKKHYGNVVFSIYRAILSCALVAFIPFFLLSYPLNPNKFKDRLFAYLEILKISTFGRKYL